MLCKSMFCVFYSFFFLLFFSCFNETKQLTQDFKCYCMLYRFPRYLVLFTVVYVWSCDICCLWHMSYSQTICAQFCSDTSTSPVSSWCGLSGLLLSTCLKICEKCLMFSVKWENKSNNASGQCEFIYLLVIHTQWWCIAEQM